MNPEIINLEATNLEASFAALEATGASLATAAAELTATPAGAIDQLFNGFNTFMLENPPFALAFLFALQIWILAWKGFALWKAGAVKKSKIWFILLLVINTYGLFEILYIFLLSKYDWSEIGQKFGLEIKNKEKSSKKEISPKK